MYSACRLPVRGNCGSNRHVSKRLGLSVWNSETTQLSNQGLLERLEAENEQLRRSVVDLMLQIQALRDGELLRLVVQATVRS